MNIRLSDQETAIINEQINNPPATEISYFSLFRYATRRDLVVISISTCCAIVGGASLPIMNLVIASIVGNLAGLYQGQTSNFAPDMSRLTLYLVYLAIGQFCAISITVLGFTSSAEKITSQMRYHYLTSLLRQNVGFFDQTGAGEITTRITSDMNMVQDGISEKLGMSIKGISTLVTAYAVGFTVQWRLTLVLTSAVLAISGTLGGLGHFVIRWSRKSLSCYAEGGSLAEEVMGPGSMRNVLAFGMQERLAGQYDHHLQTAEKFGFRMRSSVAVMAGILMFCIYSTYALAFWVGSRYLVAGEANLKDILTVLLSITSGAFAVGHAIPYLQTFGTARAAASKIYSTIARRSPLDPASVQGLSIDPLTLQGAIEFRGVRHIYPSRPHAVVLEDLNLILPAGKTTAILGPSGSGKSTIVGLLERFYNPVGGQILLDGVNIQDVNIRCLRQQVGLVTQEPVLFDTTVAENIGFGLTGYDSLETTPRYSLSDDQAMEMVQEAAKICNADEFIRQLPNGYRTMINDDLLSCGQKQRIAIARAIVSNPKILILDEPTSALDNKSEQAVQTALRNAGSGRTTVIVSHRLSTICDADNIVVMEQGCVVEQGTHEQLLQRQGAYSRLAKTQLHSRPEIPPRQGYNNDEALAASEANEEDLTEKPLSGLSTDFEPRTPASSIPILVEQPSLWSLIKFVASLNKPEWHILLVGVFCSIFCGAGNPVQAILFAKCIAALSLPATRFGELRSEIYRWTILFLVLALVELCFHVSEGISFAWCSEKLVRRAREQSFRIILGQETAYFEERSAGSLTSFLSTETTYLAGMSGVTLGTITNAVSTLCIGCIIAVVIGWKLALVCMTTMPIVLSCAFLRFWATSRLHSTAMKAYSASASYACESISAIRTISSLALEEQVTKRYRDQLTKQCRTLKSTLWTSALYGAAEGLMTLCVALGFWFGGRLMGEGEYTIFQFFAAFMAVVNGSEAAGTVFSFAPDIGKAKHAAAEIKVLLERISPIEKAGGDPVLSVQGDVEFRNVHFRYRNRENMVLRGLDLKIRAGQYVALVGSSGCGKTTTISMIERFYDPLIGQVLVDGKDIRSLDVKTYRSHIALVSQEPRLYQGTIKDNILLSVGATPVSDGALEQACRDANIYDFIMSLPDGFETNVGSKAVMLSGGQKQRIALARAFVRNPSILLLDEVTSAVDAISEEAVQAALDKTRRGLTTIAIAHRLSTIQKADVIYVLDEGQVVESGSHEELMDRRGKYSELVQTQNGEVRW